MKIKTSELTGAALDWAVAKSLGLEEETLDPITWECTAYPSGCYNFSTDWAQGGPIIEREDLHLRKSGCEWQCDYWDDITLNFHTSYGPTPLIAAMRCFVASQLGDEVDVPEELT